MQTYRVRGNILFDQEMIRELRITLTAEWHFEKRCFRIIARCYRSLVVWDRLDDQLKRSLFWMGNLHTKKHYRNHQKYDSQVRVIWLETS